MSTTPTSVKGSMSNSETVIPVSKKSMPMHTEEDFLDVDKPIPGQNYACISFLSPEKTIASKELWAFYHYHQYVIKEYNKIFTELTTKVMEKDEDEVTVADVVDLRKRMKRVFDMNEVNYTKWQELVEDWKFKELEGVNKAFDEQNNLQTSVRGVKVRGVYNTYEEASVRSKVLQRLDSRFDVFVGQVGYWLSWHPDSSKIENCEYLNEDLNTLMKEYKNNESKRDMFYQEQTRQRTTEAREQTERMKKQLEEERAKQLEQGPTDTVTESSIVTSQSAPEVDTDALSNSLTGMDPWMQRKQEQAAAAAQAAAATASTTQSE